MSADNQPIRSNDYYEQLRAVCRRRGFKLDKTGTVGPGKEYPLYRVRIPGRRQPGAIALVGGVHGDETSGPLSLLEFLRRHRPAAADPPLILLPFCNPYGAVRYIRKDHRRLDLNRHFLDRRPPEHNRLLMRALGRLRLSWFVSLHEDGEGQYYLHVYGKRHCRTYRRLLLAGSMIVPVTRRRKLDGQDSTGGLIYDTRDGSFEQWAVERGAEHGVCIEVPDHLPMRQRIALNLKLIAFIVRTARRNR